MAGRPGHQHSQQRTHLKLTLLGAGGHAKSCTAVIESCGWQVIGFLDRIETVGRFVEGYPILGTDSQISEFLERSDGFLISVGQIESADVRKRLFDLVISHGGRLPHIVASTALVDRRARLGSGTIVMHNAFVNVSADVGMNCILNSRCVIEHDAVIGDHVHISTGALINGGCTVGTECFVGSGAILRNNVTVDEGVVVGAGAVVVSDLTESGTYVGNPARRIK